jgi:hypothetical protein
MIRFEKARWKDNLFTMFTLCLKGQMAKLCFDLGLSRFTDFDPFVDEVTAQLDMDEVS